MAVVVSNVRDGLGGDGRYMIRREGDILTIHGGCRIGGIGADVIERTRGQAGHGAGEGPNRTDRAIRGLAIRGGRIGGCAPDDTMLGRIGHTQGGDVAIPGGGGGRDIRDRLRGDRRREQSREGDILAVHVPTCIGGIGADMIQRTRRQVGDGAGEGTGRADRSIHGFVIQDGGIGRKCSRRHHAGWDWANLSR